MSAPDPREVARLLRQRHEMGAPPLVLDGGTREALLGLLEGLDRKGPAGTSAEESAAPAARGSGDDRSSSSAAAAASLPVLPDTYDALRDVALACTRCGLSEGRTQVVFSDGPVDARVMVVGEAPGANEDATGLPFVGAAGKLLDLLLMSVGLSREEEVYICNILKCRPPGNRNPRPEEIASCTPFLRRQIELVRPEVILGVGGFAAQFLTGTSSALGKLRGEVYSYQGVPAVVTYHPAALLRNAGWTRPTWNDLQLLRQVLDRG